MYCSSSAEIKVARVIASGVLFSSFVTHVIPILASMNSGRETSGRETGRIKLLSGVKDIRRAPRQATIVMIGVTPIFFMSAFRIFVESTASPSPTRSNDSDRQCNGQKHEESQKCRLAFNSFG